MTSAVNVPERPRSQGFHQIGFLATASGVVVAEIAQFRQTRPTAGLSYSRWITPSGTGVSFDTFRPSGFNPPIGLDVNSDGFMDLVTSADGKGIEIFLGGTENLFRKRSAIQKLPSAGVINFADFDNDGLPDFVLFDPQRFDTPVQIGINRGELPGSPRSISIGR